MSGDAEVPAFSRCVVGFRAWDLREDDELWPVYDHRRPWTPGINVARCNCKAPPGTLRFQWTSYKGHRHLDLAPAHAAPGPECSCGLHSWRVPQRRWTHDAAAITLPRVVGAVACWGRMQVHATGLRAQYACVVALAHHPDADAGARAVLDRVAGRYHADRVGIDELTVAAQRHGAPLPDAFRPQEAASPPPPPAVTPSPTRIAPAPDLGPDDVALPEPVGFDGHPLHHTGLRFTGGGYPGTYR